MKVFGGNGQRVSGKKDTGRQSRGNGAGNADYDYINDDYYGNNSKETARKERKAAKPAQRTQVTKKRTQKKKKKGKGVLVALFVILILVVGAFGYWKLTTKPPEVSTPTSTDSGDTTAQPGASADITDTATREIGRYYTILIVGDDQIKCNTDTIMLARYDAVNNSVNVVSIPRDTLVNISSSVKKINTIYFGSKDGKNALMDEIENISGFRPDSYVIVDTSVFEKVIDTLGGVYFDVPVDMNYEDPTQNLSIHISKGYQWLSGEDTLKVFRYRHGYAMGDIDRLNVQHDLIKACASQMLKLGNVTKLYEAAKIVSENTDTNLTYGNLQWYAQKFMSMSSDSINLMTMPGDYSCSIRGVSYVSISVDEWVTMINQYFNPLKAEISSTNLNILYKLSSTSTGTNTSDFAVTNGGKIAGGVSSFAHSG